MAENDVIVKKIKPYPISAQFTKDSQIFKGQILKLVMHGFMVELGSAVVKVGEIYQVQFQFPVLNDNVQVGVKVIKTYDKYQGNAGESRANRLAEFHFVLPGEDLKKKVKSFLKVIRQTGNDIA